MNDKDSKPKMIIFMVNTLRQPLYMLQQATKSNPDLSEPDTLVLILSTDRAVLHDEEPEVEIQELAHRNNLVIESGYTLFKIMAMRDEDLIFDAQYSYYDGERIAVVTLIKRESSDLN